MRCESCQGTGDGHIKGRPCSDCDGTGERCDVCGEAVDEVGQNICNDCNGDEQ